MGITGTAISQGAWANGKILIVSHQAVLPHFCVKCGRPAEPNLLRKSFRWHPSWMYIFVVIALLIYLIVSAIASKRITVQIPLCARHREKHKTLGIAGAVLVCGSILEIIFASAYSPEGSVSYGYAAGFLAFVAGIVCLVISASLLRPTKIDDHYGYFANASEDFLRLLPSLQSSNPAPR